MNEELIKLRKEIEAVDKDLATLFNKRMDLVKKINNIKKKLNLDVLDKDREKYLLDLNKNYIDDQEVLNYYQRLYKELLNISKEYQKGGK